METTVEEVNEILSPAFISERARKAIISMFEDSYPEICERYVWGDKILIMKISLTIE